jgi:hypothetical protein
VYGSCPAAAGATVREAADDRIGEAETRDGYVIAMPVIDGGRVVGVLQAQQRLAVADRRIRPAWASMALLAFAVIGGAAVSARRLARRIAGPVEDAMRERADKHGEAFLSNPAVSAAPADPAKRRSPTATSRADSCTLPHQPQQQHDLLSVAVRMPGECARSPARR